MASQESSSQQSERRARKGKAPMEGPSAHIFKEEDEEVKASHREIIMSKAMKDCFHYVSHQPVTRWNFIDLSCNTPIFNSYIYYKSIIIHCGSLHLISRKLGATATPRVKSITS